MKADYGNAWNNLGVVEESLGQNATALADYQRAANLGNRLASGNFARLKQLSTRQQAPNRGGGPTFFCMTTGTTLHAGQICPNCECCPHAGNTEPPVTRFRSTSQRSRSPTIRIAPISHRDHITRGSLQV
jgi:hypothetical protein